MLSDRVVETGSPRAAETRHLLQSGAIVHEASAALSPLTKSSLNRLFPAWISPGSNQTLHSQAQILAILR
jgi:hypothetical protein